MAETEIERIMAALQAGDAIQAEQACHRLLAAQHDNESVLTLLSMALQQQQRPMPAAAVYARLTRLYPDVCEHWNNLATMLREAGQLGEAEQAYQTALALAPDNVVTLGNLGLLYKERAEYVNAREYLLRAAQGDPEDLRIRVYAAMACYECGDNATVKQLLVDRHQWPRLDDELRIDLAWLLAQMGHTRDAEQLLNESLQLSGKRILTMARMVLLLERVNRLDEAHAVLASLPNPATLVDETDRNEVIGAMAVMAQRGRDPEATRKLLGDLIALTPEPRHRGNLYFALAKACDKGGDTDAALAALAMAHAIQLQGAAQLVPELLLPGVQPLGPALIRMTTAQAADWPAPIRSTSAPPSPIFVVGFPRSGTTMLEQMLDAHPSLASMDEQPFMQAVAERVIALGLQYPEELGRLDAATCDVLRQDYWGRVEASVSLQPGQRLVDKNPLNLLHLPLIQRLFPDAAIILALRHPCDVILSCYMQNFRAPGFQVLCSSMDRLARGYINGMQYWIHHEQLFKPHVLHLRYEDLLDRFDAEVDRIGAFIGIDDAAPLRNFHRHAQQKGFISTPSYAQVTQPPNKSAVDRWRRYESAFIPLLPILKDVMEHWGYDR
jgi:Flp pilus assembly protein TadD